MEKAVHWRKILDENPGFTQAQLADIEGVSRFVIAQHMRLAALPEEIVGFITALRTPEARRFFSERKLRAVLSAPENEKIRVFDQICVTWRAKSGTT